MDQLIVLNAVVLIVLLAFFAVSFVTAYRRRAADVFARKRYPFRVWVGDWLAEMSHEFAGALLTGLLIFLLVAVPETIRREGEVREDLLRRFRAGDLVAIQDLKDSGKLYDGTLNGADLRYANLQGARLEYANLEGANLGGANLQGAILEGANLQGVYLAGFTHRRGEGTANLEGALLWNVNLQGANISGANLKGTNLVEANLQGADLSFANLRGAVAERSSLQGANLAYAYLEGTNLNMANLEETILQGARFNNETMLPNMESDSAAGSFPSSSFWMPDTDMTRFTDPNHPNFWRPEPGSVWWYPQSEGE